MTAHSKSKRTSQSSREAIIRAYTSELGSKSVALTLNVPIDIARRLVNRFKRTGLIGSHDCGGRRTMNEKLISMTLKSLVLDRANVWLLF